MIIGEVASIVVFMAVNTAEGFEIARRGVAIRALIPFSFVFSAKNGEIQLVVLRKITRVPAGFGGMAGLAVGWEIARLMVGAGGGPEIRLMTSKTIGRGIGKVSSNMTARAIIDQMPTRQWKKQVIGSPGHPFPFGQGQIVASRAIGGIPGSLVIGRSGGLIRTEVTIHALIPNSIKAQKRFRKVAILAIRQLVVPQQRKAVLLVYFGNIVHQPTV
jgi:hypothetical protein